MTKDRPQLSKSGHSEMPISLRWVLALAGIALCGASVYLYCHPPLQRTWYALGTPAAEVLQTQSDMPFFLTGCIVSGVILIIFGSNGLRVRSVSREGIELFWAQEITRVIQTEPTGQASPAQSTNMPDDASEPPNSKRHVIDGIAYTKFDLAEIPKHVLKDAESNFKLKKYDVEFAYRQSGKGNHAWYLQKSNSPDVYRLTYGGRPKVPKGSSGDATPAVQVSGTPEQELRDEKPEA